MSTSLDPATKHQAERMVDDLCSEFAGQFTRSHIEEVMDDSLDRILETATVFDFVPLMAYRLTRERLHALRRAQIDPQRTGASATPSALRSTKSAGFVATSSTESERCSRNSV